MIFEKKKKKLNTNKVKNNNHTRKEKKVVPKVEPLYFINLMMNNLLSLYI